MVKLKEQEIEKEKREKEMDYQLRMENLDEGIPQTQMVAEVIRIPQIDTKRFPRYYKGDNIESFFTNSERMSEGLKIKKMG